MKRKILVFTDLDGTLLDHYTYQTTDAEPTIAALHQHHIPIIPNSSKTFSEIMLIREQLNLDSPFIIENGAAVYIPINHFSIQPKDTELKDNFWVKSFCPDKDYWNNLLVENAAEYKMAFEGFSEMTVDRVASLTGLSVENATMAKERQYGEPLNWTGSEATKTVFITKMKSLGANVLEGGRFLHISGHCDKGKAQNWLAEQYLQQAQQQGDELEVNTIALGDGKNDIAMLEAADTAIQIKSPVHDFPPLERNEGVIQSEKAGPAGWAECLTTLLKLK